MSPAFVAALLPQPDKSASEEKQNNSNARCHGAEDRRQKQADEN
jgi:hypothetical protein